MVSHHNVNKWRFLWQHGKKAKKLSNFYTLLVEMDERWEKEKGNVGGKIKFLCLVGSLMKEKRNEN